MRRLILALLMPLLAWYGPVQAQLTIEVTGGVEGPSPSPWFPSVPPKGRFPGLMWQR